jgi:hypothetical protein
MIFLCITSTLLQLALSVARELLMHYLSLLQLAVYMAREESVLLVARIVELHIRRARLQVVKHKLSISKA